MFEDGSDMENIILKYNVGDNAGIVSYTIDAIKYIDGTEIKDVIIDGNKTVKAGIYEDNMIGANITNETISTNSIAFNVNINDNYELLKASNATLYACLYDGANLLDKKELQLGDNSIEWSDLKTSTMYEYGIAGYYDNLTGNGLALNVLKKKAFYTKNVVLFKDIVVGQDNIKWTYLWDNSIENKSITSLKLYKGTEESVLDVTATSIDNLLSNTEYRLVAEYANLDKTESIEVTFKTHAKAVPTIEFKNIASTKSTVSGEYIVTDPDNINTIDKVEIYNGETLVKASADKAIAFDTLEYYTDYTIKVSYHYDLNDGVGVHNDVATYDIKTQPHVDVTSVKVSNTSAVSEGDTIYMQATLDNKMGATIDSVVVNGVEYSVVNTSTANRAFVEIVYNGQFAGGDTVLTIEKINASLDGNPYVVDVDTAMTANVFINGKLDVLSISYVNEQYEPIDWCYASDKVYGLIKLNNPTKYTVDSLSIKKGNNEATPIVPTKIDDETYYFDVVLDGYDHITYMSLTEVSFHNEYITKKITYSSMTCSIYKAADDTTHYIRTAEDLKHVNDGYYYELANDIDLDGIEWHGVPFNGIIDGKGYAIKNMSYVGTVKNATLELGLFIYPNGSIMNINMVGITFILDIISDDGACYSGHSVGGISNHGGTIINCTIDETSVIQIDNKNSGDSDVGGISGSGETITNCTNSGTVIGTDWVGGISGSHGTITNCTNNGTVTGDDAVGGISGSGGTITNCTNIGTVTGNNHVGGISGWTGIITNCMNSGSVTGNGSASGISSGGTITNCTNSGAVTSSNASGISSGGTITNCANSGTVTGNNHVGGISDYGGTITNCTNNGTVAGADYVGGISGSGGTITNCMNNGTVTGTDKVGGISGSGGTINNCTNSGKVTGDYVVAGISGERGTMTNCVNNGEVAGNENVGGIAGMSATITNCMNTGTLSGTYFVGGIIGQLCTMTNCVDNGLNLSEHDTIGLAGTTSDANIIVNSYTATKYNDYDPRCTIAQLNDKTFYIETLGWSEDIWDFSNLDVENGKYPTLKNVGASITPIA